MTCLSSCHSSWSAGGSRLRMSALISAATSFAGSNTSRSGGEDRALSFKSSLPDGGFSTKRSEITVLKTRDIKQLCDCMLSFQSMYVYFFKCVMNTIKETSPFIRRVLECYIEPIQVYGYEVWRISIDTKEIGCNRNVVPTENATNIMDCKEIKQNSIIR